MLAGLGRTKLGQHYTPDLTGDPPASLVCALCVTATVLVMSLALLSYHSSLLSDEENTCA